MSHLSPYQLCQASWVCTWVIGKAPGQPHATTLRSRPYAAMGGRWPRHVRGLPRGWFGSDTGSCICFPAAGI
eukprot:4884712-Prymnesium_polylepis.1